MVIIGFRKLGLFLFFFCVALGTTSGLSGQTSSDTLPDSPTPHKTPLDRRPPTDREESWRALPGDFLHDQKEIWTAFPVQMAKGRHWLPVLATAGGTAGLIYADPHIMPWMRSHQGNLDDVNDVFDAYIATGEVAAIPASLLAAGYMRHDRYQVSTALLCADAYADSAIVDLAMKAVTRRERPSDVPPGKPFTDTFFSGNESPVKGSSFPSGHAVGAFSVATVVARRYGNHRWVPWTVYGFATVIGLSRVTDQAHFPSDVFLGSVVGYTVARFQTLRPR
ncbi:MAG: phosphatase PAP2 family protein [Acidobacteriaceae bacterium]